MDKIYDSNGLRMVGSTQPASDVLHRPAGEVNPDPEDGSKRGKLRLGRLATAATAAVVVSVSLAPHAPVVGRPVRAAWEKVWDSSFGKPTNVDELRDEFKGYRDDPASAPKGEISMYTVGDNETPGQLAGEIAGTKKGDFPAIKADLQADEKHGVLQPGPNMVETVHLNLDDPAVKRHTQPFPNPDQR